MSFRVFIFLYRMYFYTHAICWQKKSWRTSQCWSALPLYYSGNLSVMATLLALQICIFLWKLSCHKCVPWILHHPNDPALARGNSKSSRRSYSWLPLHPFWTGNMRFDLISKTAAPTVYYTVGHSCVSIISLFGQFTRRPRSVSKGTRVTVTQSAYCRDKQTGLIQPKQHY